MSGDTTLSHAPVALRQRREKLTGIDVISFIESIDQGFTSKTFGEPRQNSVRKLVIAAIENFAAKGYHGTTTRDIARDAEMSPAALYVHFASKQDLLFKITKAMATAMVNDLRRAAASTSEPVAQMRALVISYVRCTAYMHTAVQVATREYQVLDDAQRIDMIPYGAEVRAIIDDCLLAGQAQGKFAFPDLIVMRTAILTMCVSVSGWFSVNGALTPEEIGQEYARLVLRMVETGRD
jgi:AcrR family transcriptional regulator